MKSRQAVLIAVLWFLSVGAFNAQSARDYFNELYKAGGLDRMADEYVCFDDDPVLENFFIYADSKILKAFFVSTGNFAKLPKGQQEVLNKGFLNTRVYNKGVPQPDEQFFDKDGDTWVTDPFTVHSQNTKFRMRLNIVPGTLRYKKAVETLNDQMGVTDEVFRYGKCEEIPPTVRQTAN